MDRREFLKTYADDAMYTDPEDRLAMECDIHNLIVEERIAERQKCASELDGYAERFLASYGITESDAFTIKMSAFMLRAGQYGETE
jgi:hypothetical protein